MQAINALSEEGTRGLLITGKPGCGMESLVRSITFTGQNTMVGQPILVKRIVELLVGEIPDRPRDVRILLEAGFKHAAESNDQIIFVRNLADLMQQEGRSTNFRTMLVEIKTALEVYGLRFVFTMEDADYATYRDDHISFFQKLNVLPMQPASPVETRQILKNLAPILAKEHRVRIHPKTLKTTIKIAEEYYTHEALPGSAIHLLDQACLRYVNKKNVKDQFMEHVDPESMWHLRSMVMGYDVKRTASDALNIDILSDESEKWALDLNDRIARKVFGQTEAIGELVDLCGKLRSGIDRRSRPSSVWVLTGPDHVGKTATAQVLARELLGARERLIRIDLSKYRTPELLNRILWEDEECPGPTPPGKHL